MTRRFNITLPADSQPLAVVLLGSTQLPVVLVEQDEIPVVVPVTYNFLATTLNSPFSLNPGETSLEYIDKWYYTSGANSVYPGVLYLVH